MNQKLFEKLFDLLKNTIDSTDVPVASLVVKDNEIVGQGFNTREKTKNVSAHAEINAMNDAMKNLNTTNLSDCALISTLEPCSMCYSAAKQAKIAKVEYLVENDNNDSTRSLNLHDKNIKLVKVGTVDQQEIYKKILSNFFKNNIRK